MELYEKCLRVLEMAQNDTEKFGALLIVQKTLKSDLIPQSFRKDVFRAIGSDFFSRMLHTEVVPDGCPPFIFKSLSFSLLAALLSDSDDLEIINVILDECDIAKQIMITSPKFDEEEKMIEDVIYCLNAAISNEEAQKKLINTDIASIFVENALLNGRHSKKSLELLMCLLMESPRETWMVSGQAIYNLLDSLVNCLNTMEAENFDIEDLIVIRKIIESHPIGHLDPLKEIGSEKWLVNLRNGMFNIIKSKVFRATNYRELILNLAGSLTEKFGIAWLGLTSCNMATKEARQFVAILVHVSSIEVCVLFDDCLRHPNKFNSLRHSTILSCYNVIDCIITVTSDHIWEIIHDYTKQILDSVNSTMASIMNFLNEVSVFWEDHKDDKLTYNFVIASIRLLCAWMTEETSALRNEICDVMPFIIDLSRNSLKNSENEDGSDILKFILPPLCHLSVDNKTRRVLMQHNIASLLKDYMEILWKDLKLTCPTTEKEDEKIATICGILLNLVVMEGQTISTEETFFHLFKFLYTSLPQLSIDNSYLILQANFSVLGLLIARQFYERLRTCEVSFYKFLSSSIKFLWNAYDIRQENARNILVLTKDYYSLWGDLKELWFLGLQTLTSLFSMVPWIGQFLVTSGWPDQIISSLGSVDVNEIEMSVKSAYQNFLCCLVKLCPDEFKSVQTILDVSAKHNMKELESLLLAVDISGSQDISVAI